MAVTTSKMTATLNPTYEIYTLSLRPHNLIYRGRKKPQCSKPATAFRQDAVRQDQIRKVVNFG